MNKEVEVLKEVERRKMTYLGHRMQGSKYLIIQGKIVLKMSIGRRRIMREWLTIESSDFQDQDNVEAT